MVTPLRRTDVADSYLRLVESLADVAMLLLDERGHVLTWTKGAEALKGYRSSEVVGRHISVFYTPEAVAIGYPDRELELAALTGRYVEEGWRVRKDGTRFWARVQLIAIRDDDGRLTGFGKVTTDLTHERQSQEQVVNVLALLEQTVRLDHLTGLADPSRARRGPGAGDRHARHAGAPLAVAVLDLDHFKRYNDRFGHVAGDDLLKLSRPALAADPADGGPARPLRR